MSQQPPIDAIEISAGAHAFGDGNHPTTRMVLAALSAMDPHAFSPRNACDMGAGSGILSFAIAKQFACPILAVDVERRAVETLRDNAAANGLSALITAVHSDGFRHADIASLTSHDPNASHTQFDLIVMNILADPLLRLAADAEASLASGGVCIISGVLRWQEAAIIQAYAGLGLEQSARLAMGDWVCLIWQKP
jgi:ribosomal protein L11 methyltransferase